MKTIIKFMSAALCVASVASCSSNDEPNVDLDKKNAVLVEASISAKDIFSRSNPVATDERQGKFNEGDAIALTQKEGNIFGAPVKYTLTGGNWIAGGEMRFGEFPTTFRATYPGDASYDVFNLPTDQSTIEGIASADYMRKEVSLDAEPAGSKLTLTMERQMARIVVELTSIDPNCGGINTFSVVSSYAGYPAETAVATPVSAYCKDGVYYALIVPGAANAGEVVFGEACPSGKLTVSMPYSVGQIPVYYNHLMTGRPKIPYDDPYRTYSSNYLDIPNSPLYPFGYGLSYTTFDYSNPQISSSELKDNDSLTVSATVTNTGDWDADEIVQLYLHDVARSIAPPVMELKGFRRVALKAGESRRVSFDITPEMLKFYNYNLDFVAEPGMFDVMIGGSSDKTLKQSFEYKP